MTCDEFKDRMADLFDKEVDARTKAECEAHIAECKACKEHYEEMAVMYNTLHPRATPEKKSIIKETVKGDKKPRHRYWQAAAAAVIFLLGMAAGWSHLFTSPAAADTTPAFSLEQAIKCVQNVGSLQMDVFARTTPNENFDDIDPKADFMKVTIQLLRQNDSTFYRVEKQNGRTIVYNGNDQYMWVNNILYTKGTISSNFLGTFKNLLYPERLLSMQKSAVELSKKNRVTRTETDSTVTLTVEETKKDMNMYQLFKTGKMGKCPVTIQNVFTKNDGLLRNVRVWMVWKNKKVEIMHTGDIRYNGMISRADITALSEVNIDKYNDVTQRPSIRHSRLRLLRKEHAEQAAQRIIECLISGDTENAKEALKPYDERLGFLKDKYKGCNASEYTERKDDSYAGKYIFFTLTRHDGTTQKMYIALRNDNDQHIWIADGGM